MEYRGILKPQICMNPVHVHGNIQVSLTVSTSESIITARA